MAKAMDLKRQCTEKTQSQCASETTKNPWSIQNHLKPS